MIKEILKQEKVKSYMNVTEDIFPIILCYHNKEYEIRYTPRGGLIMKGYERNLESIDK
jgi:hypothetical protein